MKPGTAVRILARGRIAGRNIHGKLARVVSAHCLLATHQFVGVVVRVELDGWHLILTRAEVARP